MARSAADLAMVTALNRALRARVEGAESRQRARLLQFEREVLDALRDVENSWERFTREQDRVRSLRAARTARVAVDRAQDLYRDGVTDFLNVLDNERALNRVEVDLERSRTRSLQHTVALYVALGGGWKAWEEPSTE